MSVIGSAVCRAVLAHDLRSSASTSCGECRAALGSDAAATSGASGRAWLRPNRSADRHRCSASAATASNGGEVVGRFGHGRLDGRAAPPEWPACATRRRDSTEAAHRTGSRARRGPLTHRHRGFARGGPWASLGMTSPIPDRASSAARIHSARHRSYSPGPAARCDSGLRIPDPRTRSTIARWHHERVSSRARSSFAACD